ncbi:MAG: polyisoprenoid-binding protein [Calothrix sp. SM1_5_4]|nr:polyisoprenoid-binding protein [Calothrix sp. SM1_5_4]
MRLLLLFSLLSGVAFAQVKEEVHTYKVDASHSSIVFKVSHMGFANVYGMIPGLEGSFIVNESKPEKSSFDVSVKAENINTHDKKRDEHLRGLDFFNVKQFPTISLKSKSVKKSGDGYEVSADLNMHGVTKPIGFTFRRFKTGKDPWGKIRTGGEAVFKIKRSDFNMTYMSKPGELGDEVELVVAIEGIQQ